MPASAPPVDLVGNALAVTPYTGFVATRGMAPTDTAANAPYQTMSRTLHYARTQIVGPRPVFACGWYVTNTNVETVVGTTGSVKAAIEYPLGVTVTPLTFGGNAVGNWTAGDTLVADPHGLVIPDGELFAVRFLMSYASGWVYVNNYPKIIGEMFASGTTTTDLVNVTTTFGATGALSPMPLGIVASTTKRSFLFLQDSFCGYSTDTSDQSGDFGILARGIGPTHAYAMMGRPSVSASQFTALNAPRRIALGQYATDVINGQVRNDIGAANSATVITSLQAIPLLFPGKRMGQVTVLPTTTGAWTLLDGSDQTGVNTATRATVATAVRAGLTGYSYFVDVAAPVELSPGANLWKATSIALAYTGDGIHTVSFGYRLIGATGPGFAQLSGEP